MEQKLLTIMLTRCKDIVITKVWTILCAVTKLLARLLQAQTILYSIRCNVILWLDGNVDVDEILYVNIERAQVARVCIIQTLLDNTDEDEALHTSYSITPNKLTIRMPMPMPRRLWQWGWWWFWAWLILNAGTSGACHRAMDLTTLLPLCKQTVCRVFSCQICGIE